jgi:hypothetical protein
MFFLFSWILHFLTVFPHGILNHLCYRKNNHYTLNKNSPVSFTTGNNNFFHAVFTHIWLPCIISSTFVNKITIHLQFCNTVLQKIAYRNQQSWLCQKIL